MPRIITTTNRERVEEWVRRLVKQYYYLPYGFAVDLWRIPQKKRCSDLECIKEKAVQILVEDTEESERYRQVIYSLALHGMMWGEYAYIFSRVGTKLVRENLTSALDEFKAIISSIKNGEFKKTGYKTAATIMAELVQLNFAFYSTKHVLETLSGIHKRPTYQKILQPTLQSAALIERMPIRTPEDSVVPESFARELVDFSIELRRETIRYLLEERPTKAGDAFFPVYYWAKRELEKRNLPDPVREQLRRYVYLEVFLAPYYLHHYGFLKLDLIKYALLWELR